MEFSLWRWPQAKGGLCSFPINAGARISKAAHRSGLRRTFGSKPAQCFQSVNTSGFLYFFDFIGHWGSCSNILPLYLREACVVRQITVAGSPGFFSPNKRCFFLPKKQKKEQNIQKFNEQSSFNGFHFYWPVLRFCFESLGPAFEIGELLDSWSGKHLSYEMADFIYRQVFASLWIIDRLNLLYTLSVKFASVFQRWEETEIIKPRVHLGSLLNVCTSCKRVLCCPLLRSPRPTETLPVRRVKPGQQFSTLMH